jgi:hypothetical protein
MDLIMAKYAPIAPIKLLEDLEEGSQLGNYLLLLAHEVLDHPRRYQALVANVRTQYKRDVFIILDNSTIELGHPMDAHSLLDAARLVRADCIVLPDVVQNFHGTQALIKKALPTLENKGYGLMKIPQGKNLLELAQCVEWMSTLCVGSKDYWAVGRWVTNVFGTRVDVIRMINDTVCTTPQIHLLGMSQNFDDDIHCAFEANVMGIDSANPLVMGQNRRIMGGANTAPYEHMERGNYFKERSLLPESVMNIQYIRSIIGHHA